LHKLDIKPLSVNEAWRGRRFKTPKYSKYISDLLFILPKIDIPEGYLTKIIILAYPPIGSILEKLR